MDYSTPRYHDVVGYDRHPVFFPSFSEPIVTTNQYLSFADLKEGWIVDDLGAYCGLTAIVFKDVVGSTGRVIAVDVDELHLTAIMKNFANYKKVTATTLTFLSELFGIIAAASNSQWKEIWVPQVLKSLENDEAR